MTKTCWLIVVFMWVGISVNAQFCGFDEHKDDALNDIRIMRKQGKLEERIRHRIFEMRGGGDMEIYTIPVVFHVIHQNGSENISDELVEQSIELLNNSFANLDLYYFPEGINIPIRFCLAHVDPDGNYHTGINRVESELTTVEIPTQESELKDLSRWDTEKYLNVWVVASLSRAVGNEGIVGNATMPLFHGSDVDGLILEAAFVGGNDNLNKVFTHEVGHYLGLYHTFEGGCLNDDCTTQGDRVCDTPPDGVISPFGCEDGENSCSTDDNDLSENNPFRPVELGGLGDQTDMQNNYMDYSPLTCYDLYTLGQCERMVATLLEARATLLDGDRCNPPCTSETIPSVQASASQIFLGESVVFSNTSVGFSGATWFVNEEVVSEETDFEFVPDQAGSYFIEVLLYNDEPGCNTELEFTIDVICPVTASFAYPGENVLPDEEVELISSTTCASFFQWFMDGDLVAISEDFTASFQALGTHEVCLLASNGQCTTNYCVTFNVGSCATSRENDNWYFYTGETSMNHYEFGEGELIQNELYMDYAENKSTLSDPNGNLLYSTNGESLFDAQFNETPNGGGLSGHISSRKGSIFTPKPGSDHEHYLFTLDAAESAFEGGLRYSIIDGDLNNGWGDIEPEAKDILISVPETETMAAIRHCNYEDFWLVLYNVAEEQFESYLVDASGVSMTPVTYPFAASEFDVTTEYYLDIKVSPRATMFAVGRHLFLFDNGSGAVEHYLEYLQDEVTFYDFSPSGKYLYAQSQFLGTQVRLYQFDVTLPADDVLPQAWFMNQSAFAVYSDIQRTPDGEIFMAGVFAGTIDVIHFPDLYGTAMGLEFAVYEDTGFLNSFGNYFHAYSDEDIFIDGPVTLCKGQTGVYSVAGCPENGVNWNITSGAQLTADNQEASIVFNEAGLYLLNVQINTDCGQLSTSMTIAVAESDQPELGPDTHVCSGQSVTLTPGEGYVSYAWSTGEESSSIDVNVPGVYTVEVETANGCVYEDQINVLSVISGVIDLGDDLEICDTIIVLDAGSEFLDYVWQDGTPGQYYTVFEPGTYTVTATLPCPATDEVVVSDCHNAISDQQNAVFTVFPNPAHGFVDVFLPPGTGSVAFFMHDASGRAVPVYRMGDESLRLDIGHLAPGMYVLSMETSREIVRQRLVVR